MSKGSMSAEYEGGGNPGGGPIGEPYPDEDEEAFWQLLHEWHDAMCAMDEARDPQEHTVAFKQAAATGEEIRKVFRALGNPPA